MPTTPNLGLTTLEVSQSQKETTENVNYDIIDAAFAGGGVVNHPYDIAVFHKYAPLADEYLLRIALVRPLTLDIGLPGSLAIALTGPAGAMTFSIQKNDGQIGTLAFGAGATNGTFSLAVATAFVSGDILGIRGPSAADTTIANIGITFLNAT